jgi:hypothetical protein
VGMLCTGWGCGGVKVLPLLVVFPVRYISSVSPRFYFRRHAFCSFPLATILESLFYPFYIYIVCATTPRLISFLFIYSHVHTLFGSFFSPAPPHPAPFPGRTCSARFSNVVEDLSNNKKDKAFLLLEIKIAIQRDS